MTNPDSHQEQSVQAQGQAKRHGEPWWRRRMVLSSMLAIALATFFVAYESFKAPNLADARADAESTEFSILFPTVGLLAVGICWFADWIICILQTETFDRKNPVASVLAGSLVRTMVILGALGFSSATKWTAHNSFGHYVVGCYFSFLALESWLAIRRSATRNYSPKPL
ncbi:hypothetical protein SH449x_002100 [Pirellulaceae bacterium SH449]